MGKGLVQRLRRELGLAIPLRKPRRRRRGVSTGLPTKAEHPGPVWTWDFIHDKTLSGIMQKLLDPHGPPQYIRSDNGSVPRAKRRLAKPFIESELRAWLAAMKIKTLYIQLASPWLPSAATPQRAKARITNGHIESFHARFREECLNREQLWTLTEVRVVIEDWRWLYNNVRPHRTLATSLHDA